MRKRILAYIGILAVLIFLGAMALVQYRDHPLGGEDWEYTAIFPFQNLAPGEERYLTQTLTLSLSTFLVSIMPDVTMQAPILHHVTIGYDGERNLYCPRVPMLLFGIGTELNKLDLLSDEYGILLKRGHHLLFSVHLANGTRDIMSGSVLIKLQGRAKRKPAQSVFLSVNDYCVHDLTVDAYTIRAGKAHDEVTMERPFILPKRARLLGWSGHLHHYGSSLTLLHDGIPLSVLEPSPNPNPKGDYKETVYLDPIFFRDTPLYLEKNSILDLRVVYDKPEGLFYTGAMGEAYLLFDFNVP